MKKIFLLLLLLFFSLFVFTPRAYAIDRIYPDSVFKYNLKRLEEKVLLFLNFTSSSKAKYVQNLLEERLFELEYITETKNLAHIEKTSQRYETIAGELTELINANNLRREAGIARDKFEKHTAMLNFLRDQFKPGTAEWRFVQNDINSLSIYSQKLSSL